MGEQELTDLSLATTEIAGIAEDNNQNNIFSKYKVSIIQLILGFYFLIFAIVQLTTNYSQTSYKMLLSCGSNSCFATSQFLSFPDDSKIHIYLYAPKISQNDIQEEMNHPQSSLDSCFTYSKNKQLGKNISVSGTTLSQQDKAYPCGKFMSYYPDIGLTISDTSNNNLMSIQNNDLTVFSTNYENLQNTQNQWIDVNSQWFKSWNQKSMALGLNVYQGYFDSFTSGKLKVELNSNNKLYSKLAQQVYVTLTDIQAFDGYNVPLSVIQFLGSIFCFILGCISCWYQQKQIKVVNQEVIPNYQQPSSLNIKTISPTGIEMIKNY